MSHRATQSADGTTIAFDRDGTRITLPERTHDVDPAVLAPAPTEFFRARA